MKIKKAILPVAGFGTRFLPATKAQPKEMLPIYDTPAIQYIVEEAVAAGIEDIIIITGKDKRAIEDHFDHNFELENTLKNKGKIAELELVQNISRLANFAYVRQPEPLGDGHALLCAKNLIGEEPVVVLFGDDLVDNPNGENSVQQLINTYEINQKPTVLLEEVPHEDVSKYGIVELSAKNEITNMVEKPSPEDAPSNLAVVGKFILTPEIFDILETAAPSADGEIRLTNALELYIKQGGILNGKALEGVRFDTGDKLGFLKATLHYACKKEDGAARNAIAEFLKGGNLL